MTTKVITPKRENIQRGDEVQVSRIFEGRESIHRGIVRKVTGIGNHFPRHELWFKDGFNIYAEDWNVTTILRNVPEEPDPKEVIAELQNKIESLEHARQVLADALQAKQRQAIEMADKIVERDNTLKKVRDFLGEAGWTA